MTRQHTKGTEERVNKAVLMDWLADLRKTMSKIKYQVFIENQRELHIEAVMHNIELIMGERGPWFFNDD